MAARALLFLAAATASAEPEPRKACTLRPAQQVVLAGVSARAALSAVEAYRRGAPPPLRELIGARAEASLVDAPPPSTLHLVARALVLLLVFLPVLLGAPFARFSRTFREKVFFPSVKRALAQAGTAFIKWGQWASCRPDMFPERLYTKRQVEAEMGRPLAECFESIDKRPMASGSIAQVHKATYKGQTVAVKVRHPEVISRIVTDFILMRGLANLLARLVPSINLKSSVDQFSETMVAQTRLDVEAEHLNRFIWNFAGESWRDVAFPKPLFSSRSVLVETYEEGELVSKYTLQRSLHMGGESLDRHEAHFVVSRGEDIYLKMLLSDNLMHADLHPGNILISTSGRSPRLILLDVGMVARLTPEESSAFIGLLHACGAGDGRRAAQVVLRFSEAQTCVTPEARQAFAEDMHALFRERCRGFGTGVEFGSVLRGVLSHCRTHRNARVSLDANYMTLVMNVLCLEGMANALLPEYNVLDAARPLLAAHRRLPGFTFSLGMPVIRRIKKARDGLWLLTTGGTSSA
ncbi:hypothetical protein AB1Y20_018454 [Prymnesium parvum]|uniref:Protein kinase domain-containing protein n=1 Tax=Prymnesium parvum TaxID=97485 RepID=A0AB34JS11_PRYPA